MRVALYARVVKAWFWGLFKRKREKDVKRIELSYPEAVLCDKREG